MSADAQKPMTATEVTQSIAERDARCRAAMAHIPMPPPMPPGVIVQIDGPEISVRLTRKIPRTELHAVGLNLATLKMSAVNVYGYCNMLFPEPAPDTTPEP